MAARRDFDRHIQGGELLAVYALVSTDPFLLSRAVASLRDRVLSTAADFNRDEFRGGEASIAQVVTAAQTMPMMARQRWVHLSNAEKVKAKSQDDLLAYLQSPTPTTVFCMSAEKLDLRTKVGQRLSKAGNLFVLTPPKQQGLATWLYGHAESMGLRIERQAAALLADLVGVQLGVVDTTLQQLAIYAGQGQSIKTEHVEALVAPTRVSSIFELTDAIGARNMATASLLVRNALGGGQSALLVLAMVARHLRQLLHIKNAEAEGTAHSTLAQAVGVPPFLIDSLVRQARQYTTAELWHALGAAATADVRLKSTRLDHGVILDRLLVDMMGATDART